MASTASKKLPARAAQRLGNLNPHQPQLSKLLHKPWRKLLFVVHRAHRRRDRLLRELPHRRVKQLFFFTQALSAGKGSGSWSTRNRYLRHRSVTDQRSGACRDSKKGRLEKSLPHEEEKISAQLITERERAS